MPPSSARTKDVDTQLALAQQLYRRFLQHPEQTVDELASAVGIPAAQAELILENLDGLGLLTPSVAMRGGYVPVDPEAALLRLMGAQERQAARFQHTLEASRAAIQTIITDFISIRSELRESAHIEVFRSAEHINSFLYEAVSALRSHEATMHPGGVPPVEVLDEMLLRDKEVMDRGIKVRSLYERHIAEIDYFAEYLTEVTRMGMEVRLTDHLPMRMLLFDEDCALVPVNPQDSAEGALTVHGAELVRSFLAMFDYCWHNALPWGQLSENLSLTVAFSTQERLIIRMLASGAKDEVIARQLGVSPRTLSRMISGLLERLGVQSRFQAALKIASLGGLTFH